LLEAIFLGILQGLTEFLPISSSAHLRIAGLFNERAADPGATFTAIIQIGTELAVLIFFRKDISKIISSWTKSIFKREHDIASARLGWFVIIGSLPIVLFGVIFQEIIRNELRSLWIVASVLIIFGIILGLADRFGGQERDLKEMKLRDGLLAGFAQSLALIPGVSRSGSTIAICRLLGFNRVEALRFSFLLAIPAVLASGLFELYNSLQSPELNRFSYGETAIATLISFTVGYLVIAWLIKFVRTNSFALFVIYRVALGTTLLLLLGTGVISN
jgi:undecaprenyl-diphosphatase